MPVALWSDRLLFLLVAGVVAYFLYVRRRPHLLVPWGRVTHSAYGMSALVFLSAFVGIGLLDSLHYRPALER